MSAHVVVIGAGIIGAASALEALSKGFRVTILEPGEPGGEQAASYGNGCWLSPMSVIPPATPGIWKRIPRWLSDPLGPLAVRWSYLPRVAPWLLRYLWAGWTEEKVAAAARAIRPMIVDAPRLHLALAERAGAAHLIERKGLMYTYETREQYESEGWAWRIRKEVGIDWLLLGPDEMRQREPDLDRRYQYGALVEEGGHCRDPGAYVAALVAQARAEGADLRRGRATGFRIEDGRLRAVLTEDGEIPADKAVISAGARSKQLAAAAGSKVPLETERGYHAVIEDAPVGPRIPIMPYDGKMCVTPTEGGLRCAGQVEIAGLDAAPNWKRAEILRDHMLRSFPGLPRDLPAERVKVWMGHRPSLPDGLPCLGPAAASADVLCAFGHGHIGLVSGARSGRVVAQLLAGEAPEIPIDAFRPSRFA
jgi:D-amino-acid dehydrogenase